jgi:hypothetical protein
VTLREKLEDGITVAFDQYASYEDARQAGIVNIAADAAILALRDWLEAEGLVVVPREATERMQFIGNEYMPSGGSAFVYRTMIAAAPDALREGEKT